MYTPEDTHELSAEDLAAIQTAEKDFPGVEKTARFFKKLQRQSIRPRVAYKLSRKLRS